MSVSWNAGNFGNLTTGQSSPVENVRKEVQDALKELDTTSREAQSLASQYSDKSGNFTDQARTYQAMADSTDDPTLKAQYQKKADDFKKQAEEAKEKFGELNSFLKEVQEQQTSARSQLQALDNYGKTNSGEFQFKSADMLEAEGKTYHSFAKDGNHWYADEPKGESNFDVGSILKGIKDFFGSASFSAYDSMRKDNPNGIL